MELLLAIQFLTRIPITVRGDVQAKNMARSMVFYPFVGLLLGFLSAGLYYLASIKFPGQIGILLAIILIVMITGNIHIDGLMDTSDGIFSGRPRERMLEIMKDSRVGAHGVVAGVLILMAKFVFLGQIDPNAVMLALILIPVLGRWSQVYGSTFYPYARAGGGLGSFTDLVGMREIIIATVTALVFVFVGFVWQDYVLSGVFLGQKQLFTAGLNTAILAGTVFLGMFGVAKFISGKIGGLTGDSYGAMSEVTEILALAVLYIIFS